MKKKEYIIIVVILLVGLGLFFGLKTYLDKNYEKKENNSVEVDDSQNNDSDSKNINETLENEILNNLNSQDIQVGLSWIIEGLNHRSETYTEFSDNEKLIFIYAVEHTYNKCEAEEQLQNCILVSELKLLSEKYFDKEINVENIGNYTYVKDGNLYFYGPTGVGAINFKFNKVDKIDDDTYKVNFDFGYGKGEYYEYKETYDLIITYRDNNIIYKSLEKKK